MTKETNRELLDSLEAYELEDTASEEDLAVAETLLANLLVRQWLASRKTLEIQDITEESP